MAEKKYYWLKLKEAYFDNPKIKMLRKIAGGDTFTIIYLKMQLMSIRDEGILKYEGIDTDFANEIALKIDEDVENVKVVLSYLEKQSLIDFNENQNEMILYEASQSIGSECESAERVRAFRERQKMLQCNESETAGLISNISISKSNSNSIYEKEFEEIWSIYPNKQGKSKALKSYIKARKDGIECETIRDGVERYSAYCKANATDKQYISHGDTWFGNRRWTDEYEMKGANNGEFGGSVNGTNQADQTELIGEYW
jgi:predicted phage replisome organizer